MRLNLYIVIAATALTPFIVGAQSYSQTAPRPVEIWTWDHVKDAFLLQNTTLMASKLNIDELKAEEITAHLRPNPSFTLSSDGTKSVPATATGSPSPEPWFRPA